jgi:hypothetical protein
LTSRQKPDVEADIDLRRLAPIADMALSRESFANL